MPQNLKQLAPIIIISHGFGALGEHQDIGSSYFKELTVAFFEVYLRDRSDYLPYLTAAHVTILRSRSSST